MENVGGYRPVTFTSVEISVDRRRARATVAEAHARYLSEGHFPGDLFVPGAYVADWMVALARDLLRAGGRQPGPCLIERCVFLCRVEPDTPIIVEAELDEREAGRVHGRVEAGTRSASSALLRFGNPR